MAWFRYGCRNRVRAYSVYSQEKTKCERALRRVFAQAGYSVAVIARNADHVKKTVDDVKAAGGDVCAARFFYHVGLLIEIKGCTFRRSGVRYRVSHLGLLGNPRTLATVKSQPSCGCFQCGLWCLETFPRNHGRGGRGGAGGEAAVPDVREPVGQPQQQHQLWWWRRSFWPRRVFQGE